MSSPSITAVPCPARRPRVAIVQRSLRRYRVSFYQHLREELTGAGIDLRLIHSEIPGRDVRGDPGYLPWAEWSPGRRINLAGRSVLWQPYLRLLRGSDLVVVEQASQLLLNYLLLARQLRGRQRVALWGHGETKEDVPLPGSPALKRWMSRRPHWWFAYNDPAARIVQQLGFPPERITVVNNSTDSRALTAAVEAVTASDLRTARRELGLEGDNVAIFMGALSAPKRFDVLVAAADRVRAAVPDFELVVVGRGEMEGWLRDQAAVRPWMALTGHRFDASRAPLLRLAKLMLVPGWAGLVVVDSFAAGVPLVADTALPHPPELGYITDGVDGVTVSDGRGPGPYAAAVIGLLRDDEGRRRLVAGCERARSAFGVEQMAARFRAGIVDALAR